MLDFAFNVPGGDLGYQMRTEVHVIGVRSESSLAFIGKKEVKLNISRSKDKRITVYFDFDSARLIESEKKKLTKVKGKVFLQGYASPEGSSVYNLRLSERRAKAVADFLRGRGVKVEGLKGYGEELCNEPPTRWYLCRKVEVERK